MSQPTSQYNMKITLAFVYLTLAFGSASAHTIFQELAVNGVWQGRTVGVRVPEYDGPITDVTSRDVICNGGINPFRQPISSMVIKVPAGAQVSAQFHHTLTSNTGDNSDPIDPSHNGPVLAYLAKIPSATQSDVSGLKWFKIYHDGLDSNGWAVQRLTANRGAVTFTVPSCIPAGQYLLRVELIALHGARTYPGAQLYMECAQIEITGGGSTSPASTVSFPGAYSGSDPGIAFDLYRGATSYPIPGPSVFTCSGSNNPGPSSPATTQLPPVITPPTNPPPVTTAPPSGTVPQYGQCGGSGYSGPTGCLSPYTCKKQNDWYSQCL